MTQVLERFGGDVASYPDLAVQEVVEVPYADLTDVQTTETAQQVELNAAIEAQRAAQRHAAEVRSAQHISTMLRRHDPMYAGMFNNPDFQ
ncbi:hypothetical protein EYC59_05905 [Candidatus Saccharibacteria bacterium]|nr:MAG: hypothetical protein EYC59_05905 [Candidatus Saccharibacteria bacterium]